MSKAHYALRLQPSLQAAAERLARGEGTSLNHVIDVAVAEKLSALETGQFVRDRAQAASRADFMAFLGGAGDAPPSEGDLLEPAPSDGS